LSSGLLSEVSVVKYVALMTGEPASWAAMVHGVGVTTGQSVAELEQTAKVMIQEATGDAEPELDLVLDGEVFESVRPFAQPPTSGDAAE
jgi:hypothetical protein